MPAGFQCWRQDGQLVFNTNDSLSRHIGTQWTNNQASGSIYVPDWAAGQRPWFHSMSPGLAGQYMPLYIRIEGPNLVWSVTSNPDNGAIGNTLLYWGVY